MTQILHLADTHLGYRQYGSDIRREDFADAFEAAVELAIDESVDAVLHTGDLFDDPQPGVPDVTRCLDIIDRLAEAKIPFYGIVGNHERKLDEQWLDLIGRFSHVHRLDQSSVLVGGDVALYGIDAIKAPVWDSFDFDLEEPPGDADVTVLALHHLFEELVPPEQANYELAEVIDRLNVEPTALALGDYHGYEETTVGGVQAFYPGSTERCSTIETAPRGVLLLEVEDGALRTRRRTLDSVGDDTPRDFVKISVDFGEDDGRSLVETRLDEASGPQETLEDKLVVVELHGEDVNVSQRDVYELVDSRGAAVVHVVDKRRADVDLDFDVSETDVADVDSMIDDRISELDLEETSTRIEEIVRATDATRDANLRDEVEGLLRDARDERFGDVSAEASTEGGA